MELIDSQPCNMFNVTRTILQKTGMLTCYMFNLTRTILQKTGI